MYALCKATVLRGSSKVAAVVWVKLLVGSGSGWEIAGDAKGSKHVMIAVEDS